MIDLNAIEKAVKAIVDLSKDTEAAAIRKLLKRKPYSRDDDLPYPDYFEFYKQACEMRDQIKYHAEKCGFPKQLFRKRAPRMADEEFEYVEANFKQVSLPVYLDFKSTVDRIFNDTSWSITFPAAAEDEKDSKKESFRKYCEEEIPEFGSLESFARMFLPHLKLTDACGCIAIRPKDFKFRKGTEEEIAQSLNPDAEYLDNSERLNPMPIYFRVDQLKGFKSGDYFIFESDQRSEVDYGNKKKEKIGKIFEYYDAEKIVFITQIGKYSDFEFQSKVMINHAWGRIPVEFLKGVPKITKDGTMWISPFSFAVDLLDLVLLNETNHQCAINSNVYPFKIMEGNECEFEYIDRNGNKIPCDGGDIHDILSDASFKCPSCGGSGLKSNMGPMGVMIVKQATNYDSPTGAPRLRDPVMFVSPPIEPLDHLMKKKQDDEMKARKILHLNTSQSDVQPTDIGQPALKSMLDLKALYAFLSSISNQIFDILKFSFEGCAMFLYGKDSYDQYVPSIAYPIGYDFKTEGDYLAEIAAATQANLPPFVIHTIVYRYIKALYFNDQKTAAVFILLVAADRLLIFSSDQIQKMHVEDWEVILHDSGLSLIDQLATENQDFFDPIKYPADKRKEMLIKKAKDLSQTIATARDDKQKKEAENNAAAVMQKMKGFNPAAA